MLTIKQIKNELKLNQWELQKAIIDSNCNRIIELNTSRLILFETLVKLLDNKLNTKHLSAKVS